MEARAAEAEAEATAAEVARARAAKAAAEAAAEAVAEAKADAEAEARAAAGEAEVAARSAEAERTKGLMSDVYFEIARRTGEMVGVAGEAGDEDDAVSRTAMLRCVRDVIKEATFHALSASASPADDAQREGTDGSGEG